MSTKRQVRNKKKKQKRHQVAARQPTEEEVAAVLAELHGDQRQQLPSHKTARPLRQAKMLQLQRQHGNGHIQRLLASAREGQEAGVISRAASRTLLATLSYGSRKASEKRVQPPTLTASNPNAVQLTPDNYVGAVEEGYQLQDREGGMGGEAGDWHERGEGGFSRLMQGAAGEMVEGMAESGSLEGLLLQHVAPDLSGLPAQQQYWLDQAARDKEEIDSWTFGFAPGNIRDLYKDRYKASAKQVEVIDKCGSELEQKANQFNSFVPQGNGFYVSAARLSSMQTMLGATDNASLAAALEQGLADADDVMKRYHSVYEDGNRRLTTEKLDFPEGDESVTQAANEMTNASRELDAAYMGFQTTVLSGRIGSIKEEYAQDQERLEEINQVKQFVRNVGKTIDFTMSTVRTAPTMATNVTNSVRKARASVNAARNRRDIIAGNRPRFNPTYVTADADGNMVVRNMQTGLDQNLATGEKVPSPVEEGVSLPTSVSDLMGTITDFVYHDEVKKINLRLEQMKIRVNGVKAVIDATLFEQRIQEYQNALNNFATKAAALEARIEDRRKEYREFGTQLDRFAQVDSETREAGLGVARGAERYATIMTMVAAVQEMVALGTKSQSAAPSDLPAWWATVRKRRFNRPTAGETRTVAKIQGQIVNFQANVNAAKEAFSGVIAKAGELMGRY